MIRWPLFTLQSFVYIWACGVSVCSLFTYLCTYIYFCMCRHVECLCVFSIHFYVLTCLCVYVFVLCTPIHVYVCGGQKSNSITYCSSWQSLLFESHLYLPRAGITMSNHKPVHAAFFFLYELWALSSDFWSKHFSWLSHLPGPQSAFISSWPHLHWKSRYKSSSFPQLCRRGFAGSSDPCLSESVDLGAATADVTTSQFSSVLILDCFLSTHLESITGTTGTQWLLSPICVPHAVLPSWEGQMCSRGHILFACCRVMETPFFSPFPYKARCGWAVCTPTSSQSSFFRFWSHHVELDW